MADVVVIAPPDLVDGFRLAGTRVWPAADVAVANELVLKSLGDPDAGIVALADSYFEQLDSRTHRLLEHRYRPVVVSLPTRMALTPEEQRRTYLVELIRRAVGFKVVLGPRGLQHGGVGG
jgi:vacuolar-type H+-ATPase subunit F/Vma7